MGAEAGTSLLQNAALLTVGFLLGRVQLLPVVAQLADELVALSPARKAAIALGILSLVVLYMLVFLLPLNWIAKKEAERSVERDLAPTSFRRELRRRGSYSMSYVTDIKAHVYARS